MAFWIWLTSLLAFAVFIFLAISGRKTSQRLSYHISAWFYTGAIVASIIGLIGIASSSQGTDTYLFTLFGLPVHEGFRIDVGTSILILALCIVSACIAGVKLRFMPAENDETAHAEMIQLSWWTFALSLLIFSPTLGQAFVAAALCTIAVIWSLTSKSLHASSRSIVHASILAGILVVSFLAQTSSTFVTWLQLHTVQLTQLSHVGKAGGVWHGPDWAVLLWLLGVILQAVAFVITYIWMKGFVHGAVRRLAFALAVASGLYAWLAWPVIVAAHWMIWLIVLAGLIELASIVVNPHSVWTWLQKRMPKQERSR